MGYRVATSRGTHRILFRRKISHFKSINRSISSKNSLINEKSVNFNDQHLDGPVTILVSGVFLIYLRFYATKSFTFTLMCPGSMEQGSYRFWPSQEADLLSISAFSELINLRVFFESTKHMESYMILSVIVVI